MLNKETIFRTLTKVDVRPFVRWSDAEQTDGSIKKLAYLPWHSAHHLMMQNYPEYEWTFRESPQGLEVFYFADKTAEVCLMLSVGEVTTYASKAVSGYNNKAIQNPSADDIHNAKMRCRVRALAEIGLGFDLWANPDNYPCPSKEGEGLATPKREVAIESKKDMVCPMDEEEQAENQSKELFFENVLKQATSEKVAKTLNTKARRQWVNNRKWSEDDFTARWKQMCDAQGWK